MPLLPCYFFNRFKIDPDVTKSYPKSLLEVIKVTGDGHCILHAVREARRHENVKAIPSNSELLTMIKFEVFNNLDYYAKFINSADVDSVHELERYADQKSYGSDINDLVLSAISNLLKCNIMLLREGPEEFFLECGDNHITPQKDIRSTSFTIKLLWNRQHYDCLVEANKLRGKIYSSLKMFHGVKNEFLYQKGVVHLKFFNFIFFPRILSGKAK